MPLPLRTQTRSGALTYTHIPLARTQLHSYTQLDERLENVVVILVTMCPAKILLQ